MENVYMDEKWKLSKKGSYKNYSKSRREQSTTSTGSSSSGAHLKRSSSMPESVKAMRRPSLGSGSGSGSSSGSGLGTDPSPRKFSSRCANLVKEQRSKFYIMRRCVSMLMCWRDYP